MKKLIATLIFTLLLLTIALSVAYYALFRPYENIDPGDQITFQNIEPSDAGIYPVTIRNVDSLREKIIIEKGVSITMEDGIALSANVFRPKQEGRYPVVMSFTAYDKDKGPEAYPPPLNASYLPDFNLGTFQVSPWTMWEAPDPAFWCSHGYAVVQVDSRGYFKSEGAASLFDEQIIKDFHEAITWAGTQTWSNGNVGLNGVSYLAATQWLGASLNPPHLKAMIPWEGFNDFYREHVIHGGMPETNFFRAIWGRRMNTSETGFLAKGATAEDPIAEQKNRPLLDEYWAQKHPDLTKIQTPIYAVASWSTAGLHTRGSIEGFKQASSINKWLYAHGRKEWETYYAREGLERQKMFFDCFLKGRENGMRELPRVCVEVRDYFYNGRYRYFEDFPIPQTEYRSLFLNSAQSSLTTEPVGQASECKYAATMTENEADSVSWDFEFSEATDLIGHMKLKLWVSAVGADDMDLHVAIKKIDKHGNEVYFPDFQHLEDGVAARGWLRVSHRELDESKSKPWQPWLKHERLQKLTAGEIVPCEIEILPSATGFQAGDRLRLVVQGHDVHKSPVALKHEDTVNLGW